MKNARPLILLTMLLILCSGLCYAQDENSIHLQKRYNIFFKINSHKIDYNFKDNARTINQMKCDIDTTLQLDGAVPDSLLILSTASPDGSYEFNRKLAQNRAISTRAMLLEMFPQFKDAHIEVDFLEEDWDGLKQVLKAHPEFPQREEMLAVIEDTKDTQSKEQRLRGLKDGWKYLVENYIHALRNSSITISVVMTATNADDEFVYEKPTYDPIPALSYSYTPTFTQEFKEDIELTPVVEEPKYRKTILAARSNLLLPGLNVGMEIPIGSHWSVGLDYYYPWFVSNKNLWCSELLGWFIDTKYWITGKNNKWTPESKLKGHAIGVYAGVGYYDFQKRTNGIQGEYLDLGVDYTYAMPVADDKLRLEFNLGVGYISTLYRPYYPSSDYEDLIKEPGVKYRATNFIGPTRAGVSLVYPIKASVKKNPYKKMAEREQRRTERQNKRKGGNE